VSSFIQILPLSTEISRRAKYRCYGQWTDYGRLAHVMLLVAYCWQRGHENENDGANKWW